MAIATGIAGGVQQTAILWADENLVVLLISTDLLAGRRLATMVLEATKR